MGWEEHVGGKQEVRWHILPFYMHNRDVCSHRGQGMFTYCKHQTLLSGPWPGIMPSGKWGVEDLEALMHASYFSRPDGTVS